MDSNTANKFKVVRALLPLLRSYPWALPTIVVLGTLAALAEGIGIGLFSPLLQSYGEPAGSPSRCLPAASSDTVLRRLFFLCSLIARFTAIRNNHV